MDFLFKGFSNVLFSMHGMMHSYLIMENPTIQLDEKNLKYFLLQVKKKIYENLFS